MTSLQLRPGSLIVFEGLDRAGKSTQIKRLSALDWTVPAPGFVHMPSGMTDLTRNIYSHREQPDQLPVGAQLTRILIEHYCPQLGPG